MSKSDINELLKMMKTFCPCTARVGAGTEVLGMGSVSGKQ